MCGVSQKRLDYDFSKRDPFSGHWLIGRSAVADGDGEDDVIDSTMAANFICKFSA